MNLLESGVSLTCHKAVDTLGVTSQINKAKEELSELHLELDRMQSSPTKTSESNIITEIADVAIMIEQLAIIFGEEKVRNEIRLKLARLADYIELFDSADRQK